MKKLTCNRKPKEKSTNTEARLEPGCRANHLMMIKETQLHQMEGTCSEGAACQNAQILCFASVWGGGGTPSHTAHIAQRIVRAPEMGPHGNMLVNSKGRREEGF